MLVTDNLKVDICQASKLCDQLVFFIQFSVSQIEGKINLNSVIVSMKAKGDS